MRGSRWSTHPNRLHFVVLRNLVDDGRSLGDLPGDGVRAVEMPLRGMADEELAAAGVLPGMRHGERPSDVLVDVAICLALDRVARAAGADASFARLRVRVATLDHEI